MTEMMRADAVREGFARFMPLVHRFVVAELDCTADSVRGIGRLCDDDPPPRIASMFREELENPETRRHGGLWVERLFLTGFLTEASFQARVPGERDLDSTWGALLTRLMKLEGRKAADSGSFICAAGELLFQVSHDPREIDQPLPGTLALLEDYAEPRSEEEAVEVLEGCGDPRWGKVSSPRWHRPRRRGDC